MRKSRLRLLVPAVVVAALFVPAGPMASAGPGSGPAVGEAGTGSAAKTPPAETITGTVQTLVREQPRGRQHNDGSDTVKVLRVGSRVVPLTEGSLATTTDGTTVSVTAVLAADGAKDVMSSRTISIAAGPEEVAAAAADVPPVHQVYVALVRPKGLNLTSATESSVRQMVDRVSSFWASQTDAQVSFSTARVLPAYESAYRCDGTSNAATYDMWNEAQDMMPEAFGPGKHLVLVAPGGADQSGCAYGIATLGAVGATDNTVFVSGLTQSQLAHELGHNLGLQHSNSLRCSGTQDMPVVNRGFPGCQAKEYDDLFDVMGVSGTGVGQGNLNAVHLEGMDLLPNAVHKVTATSGVVTTARISPLSEPLSTATTNRVLKVTDPDGVSYFVEYRTYSGRDTGAIDSYYHASWGVRVLRSDPAAASGAGSYELDATPTSNSFDYNRVIPVGGTFNAASRKLAITVTTQDPQGATVSITVPKPAPVTRLSDFNRDGITDMVARDKAGTLWLYPGNGLGGFKGRISMGAGWNTFTAFITPGDVTRDGNGDVLARDTAGQLWLYPGNGVGGFKGRISLGLGWNGMTAISVAGDLNGDGNGDVLAKDAAGQLWLYPSTGTGHFGARSLLGAGWNAMNAFTGAGDLSGDGRADVLARDRAGNLWVYPGNTVGTFGARISAGAGWNGMTTLVAPGNLDRFSGNDLVARDGAGMLWLYPGDNAGRFSARRALGAGFSGYTMA